MLGVVIGKSSYYRDRMIVRCWSPYMKQYVEFPKIIHTLREITDPFVLKIVTTDDRNAFLAYKEASLDLALLTNDREWFEEIAKTEKELLDADKNSNM